MQKTEKEKREHIYRLMTIIQERQAEVVLARGDAVRARTEELTAERLLNEVVREFEYWVREYLPEKGEEESK